MPCHVVLAWSTNPWHTLICHECAGHIFLCQENPGGLSARQGHTELSIALARRAGVTPVMVGCVMLSNSGDDYGALGPDAAREWAMSHGVPFLEGPEILEM